MPMTPGEQLLLLQLARISSGQAPGSFGAAQAFLLLQGYLRLRDRVDALEIAAPAAQAAITDLQTRVGALEPQVADLEARVGALEPQVADLQTRVAALEHPPPPAA